MPSPALAKFATNAAQATQKRADRRDAGPLQDSLKDALSDDIASAPPSPATAPSSPSTAAPEAA